MKTIKLDKGRWEYDPDKRLGNEGGFGVVFAGSGQGHDKLAIKKLKITAKDAAHRELKIAKELAERNLSHVIPILDSGQDAESDSYFVVMALADKSLQDELDKGKIFSDNDAINILLQISDGLYEVSDIVHRDLKPANVLLHDGEWKVADFGIARFVEESTSLQTLKDCLTPLYAAPEQWKNERSTSATDIYALGCIGYSLLTGRPPFQGNKQILMEKHLAKSPTRIENCNPQLSSLLTMMLRKNPETRPDLNRIREILKNVPISDNNDLSKPGFNSLVKVGEIIATKQAKEEAKQEADKIKSDKRKAIYDEAYIILEQIAEKMFDKILNLTPASKCISKFKRPQNNVFTDGVISIGEATLVISCLKTSMQVIDEKAFSLSKWDVIAGAIIGVVQKIPHYRWSSSLWYSKLFQGDNYRWREVSYMVNPMIPKDKLNTNWD